MAAMESSQQPQPAQQPQLPQQLPPNDIQLSYKNQLQQYAQRAGLDLPVYYLKGTGEPHAARFKCSVTVDDETYESPSTFTQKKAAEQDAAKYALKCILEKRQEKGSSIISKNTILCKAILNEFAAKLQLERPKYNTVQMQQVPLPIFVSTLEFRCVSYTGGPARTKKDAERLVAHDVTISILGSSEEDSTLLEILRSKANLFSAAQLSMDPSCAIRPEEGVNSVSGSDGLPSTCNEEQFKDAPNSSPMQTCVPDPPVQTFALDCCQVTSPFPADAASVLLVPSSSQDPITPPMQVLANEGSKSTPTPEARGPVSPSPLANQSKLCRPSEQHQCCLCLPRLEVMVCREVSSVDQVNSSIFPELPQNLTTPSEEVAIQGCHVVTTAIAPNQDCSVAFASQSAERLSRSKRKRANKKARMAN